MKKILLTSLSAFGLFAVSNAQINVTSANVFDVGQEVELSADDNATINPGAPGTNLTWDFSALQSNSTETTVFDAPANVPGGTQVPASNIAGQTTNSSDIWMFFSKSATELTLVGQSEFDGTDTTVTTTPVGLPLLTFPSTYLTAFSRDTTMIAYTDTAKVDPDGADIHELVDSVRLKTEVVIASVIDAWGTITTPLGTYPALRQNLTLVHNDTLQMYTATGGWETASDTLIGFIRAIDPDLADLPGASYTDTTWTLQWWTNDAAVTTPLVTLDHDGAGNIYTARWINRLPWPLAIEDNATSNISVYPNPVKNTLNFNNLTDVRTIEIRDVTGRLVNTVTVNSNALNMSVSDYAAGMYVFNAFDKAGVNIETGKFNVVK